MRSLPPLLLAVLLASPAFAAVLFEKRQDQTYPSADVAGPDPLAAWVATYEAVKSKIPDISPSTLVNGNPDYDDDVDTSANGICSWTVEGCERATDLVNAPAGMVGISFDDGPTTSSPTLYEFLAKQGINSTHFFIGSNIDQNPTIFAQALASGGHPAVHTWSHPYLTTLSDMQILGELGWTAQIIFDLSGQVPAFFRPPFGDIDDRVRAIATEVFGLTTVIWNQDTDDWCLDDDGANTCTGEGPGDDDGLDAELEGFYSLPKSPGLIVLEHELTDSSVGGFIRTYPSLTSNGWKPLSLPQLLGVEWFIDAGVGLGGALINVTATSQNATNTTTNGMAARMPSANSTGATVGATTAQAVATGTVGPTAVAAKGSHGGVRVWPPSIGLVLVAGGLVLLS